MKQREFVQVYHGIGRIFGRKKSNSAIYSANPAPPKIGITICSTIKAGFQMTLSTTQNRVVWAVRLTLALAFGAAGTAKILAVPMMVDIFRQVGLGQWFRYVTGVVELGGAVLMMVPSTGLAGALLLGATMVGAVITHLAVIGGSPVPAVTLGALSAFVALRLWPSQGPRMLGRLGLLTPEA